MEDTKIEFFGPKPILELIAELVEKTQAGYEYVNLSAKSEIIAEFDNEGQIEYGWTGEMILTVEKHGY